MPALLLFYYTLSVLNSAFFKLTNLQWFTAQKAVIIINPQVMLLMHFGDKWFAERCWLPLCWLVIGQLFWLNALLRLAGHDQVYTTYISYFWVNHWNPLRTLYLSGLELWKISTTWYFWSSKQCFCFVTIPDYGEALSIPHSQINWDCKECSFPYQEDGVRLIHYPLLGRKYDVIIQHLFWSLKLNKLIRFVTRFYPPCCQNWDYALYNYLRVGGWTS